MTRPASLVAAFALLLACDRPREDRPAPMPTPEPSPTTPEVPVSNTPQPPELAGGDRLVGAPYSRSPVYARHGAAATAHPLASQIAIDILKKGGSAVDAAIAANAAPGLMEPVGNGIGGDLFAIVWDPSTRELVGYNGSGRSPAGRDLAQLRARLGDATEIPCPQPTVTQSDRIPG